MKVSHAFLVIMSMAPASMLVAAHTTPALAQDKLDCTNALTQQDMNQCAGQDYETADAELNAVWGELRQARDGLASWQPIVEAQRLWIPFRDAHCEAEAAPYEGGSIQPLIRLSCLAGMTSQRTAQLRDLMDQP